MNEQPSIFADRHAIVTGSSRGIGRAIAAALAAEGARVSLLGRDEGRLSRRSEEEALAALVATNPQRRLITPEEVANAALWLCKPGTESVTGQSIVIAGGEVV
jgi:NAD(P)-dependent dehydrogenase (short-subunit alcohol dehydrogenase family)